MTSERYFITGDCREVLPRFPADSIHCVVTSPPYWGLRDYGVAGQIGLEDTPNRFVDELVNIFREVRRVLRPDGTLWLNLGDSYAATTKGAGGIGKQHTNNGSILADRSWQIPSGLKPKDLVGIPWRVAFALQADGWWLRQDIIWAKPNPMPESVKDRCTKAHEYLFLLTKSERYYFDAEAIAEPTAYPIAKDRKASGQYADGSGETRNKRSVWTVTPKPFREAHFATFPPDLVRPCIQAGSPVGGNVLDPFSGAGTTGLVSKELDRNFVGIELNPQYNEMAKRRCGVDNQQTVAA
jgi:DNA modification methylase